MEKKEWYDAQHLILEYTQYQEQKFLQADQILAQQKQVKVLPADYVQIYDVELK